MKQKTIVNSIIIIITFLFAFYGKQILNDYIKITFQSHFVGVIYYYLWWLIPTTLAIGVLFGFNNLFKVIGINKRFIIGFLFSFITVLPMLLSSAIIGQISENVEIGSLIQTTILAGAMEEFLFRGFLFGILFRKLGWGFIPASIIGALIFGLGHIYQGSTFLETLGVFFITSMGAVWFSWLFVEWNYNLWIPIFLHTLMNLSWILFEVSNSALGGIYTNIFRVITIALTVIITIRYNKKNGLLVNKNNLIVNY